MIDFPTLYPNLVKYLPNWSERFYPSLAQFARGEGYPCGNQGVFIPRRNKCWTHPKTGQRLKKPLTYQMYKDAKEKSQRSRTEKGRTALETREQSFRDKAREKVKGWQKNKEEDVNSRPIPKHPTITETPFTEVNQLLGLRGYSLPDSSDMSKYVLYTAANKVRKDIKSEQDVVDEIKSNPRFNDEMSKLFGIPDTEEKIKLKQQAVDYFDKHSAKWKPIQDQGLREKVNRMTGKPATKSEPKQTPNSTGGKSAIAKPEPKPIPRPKVGTKEYDDWLGMQADELKGEKSTFNIKTKNGTESVEGFVNNGLGVHKTKGSLFGSYSVTHVKSGIGIGEFEDEKLAKKTVVELQRSGIDWNTEDLTKLPGINNKMKGAMRTIEQVKTSDLRTKSARNNAIRLEKLKARQAQLDADTEKERQSQMEAKQKAEIEKQQRLEKERIEREHQVKMMQEKGSEKTKPYVSPRVGIAINSIESDLNPDTWRSKISDAEEKLQKHKTIMETRGSRKYGGLSIVEEKRTKEQLKTAKTRLEQVDRFLGQDNIETVPGFLEMPIQTLLTNGRSGDEVKTLIESTQKKYKKKQPKKNDFNSHQLLAQFGIGSLRRRKSKQTTCCCESPNLLRRRKTKQTAKLRRRGNKYA